MGKAGCFAIKKTQTGYQFEFNIALHIDDLAVLNFIQSRLNMGKVYLNETSATLKINRQAEVSSLIDLIDLNPLNTTKRLDFEDFKKAFNIYVCRNNLASLDGSDKSREQAKNRISVSSHSLLHPCFAQIEELKNGMNKNRPYAQAKLGNVKVTGYWLLGFIEGEGNFYIDKSSLAAKFRLGQSSRDRVLLEQVAIFFFQFSQRIGF